MIGQVIEKHCRHPDCSPLRVIPLNGRTPTDNVDDLPLFIGQKLPGHGDSDTITVWIRFFLHIQAEVDSAHDSISEFLMDHGLQWYCINLHDFVETINKRVSRYNGTQTFCGTLGQCLGNIRPEIQYVCNFFASSSDALA